MTTADLIPPGMILAATLVVLVWTVVGAWCIARMWDGWQKAESARERAQQHREHMQRELVACVIALSKDESGHHLAAILATKREGVELDRPPQRNPRVPVS